MGQSGRAHKKCRRRLANLIYLLIRDKLPLADVVDCIKLVENTGKERIIYTNKGLEQAAHDFARRVLQITKEF